MVQLSTSSQAELQSVPSPAMQLVRPLCLVSDLDDTLVSNLPGANDATRTLRDMLLRSRAAGMPCTLVYNTGRTLPYFEMLWDARKDHMPEADVLIGGVGTRIYHATPQGWQEDLAWTARMGLGWGAPELAQEVFDQLAQKFGGDDNVEYNHPLELHNHKITVHYREHLRPQFLEALHQQMGAAGITFTLVEGQAGKGPGWRFIDVVPKGAGKGAAMEYVRTKLGFSPDQTVACGDSNNDLLMLDAAHQAIAVGNSNKEVRAWAAAATARSDRRGRVVLAKSYAAFGILEGLKALDFIEC